jgi:uncharacterized FlaG/YvyC family protein
MGFFKTKEEKYTDAINKLVKDATKSADGMAELAFVLHKGIAVLIMYIQENYQEEMIKEIEPMIRDYLRQLKERHPNHNNKPFKA